MTDVAAVLKPTTGSVWRMVPRHIAHKAGQHDRVVEGSRAPECDVGVQGVVEAHDEELNLVCFRDQLDLHDGEV
jgi:hypothetical protein